MTAGETAIGLTATGLSIPTVGALGAVTLAIESAPVLATILAAAVVVAPVATLLNNLTERRMNNAATKLYNARDNAYTQISEHLPRRISERISQKSKLIQNGADTIRQGGFGRLIIDLKKLFTSMRSQY